jgi:hypothetical protein
MKKITNPALNAEQHQQDMASALVINPTDLDYSDQPSATGCAAQPSAGLSTATSEVNAGSTSESKTKKALDCFTKMSN